MQNRIIRNVAALTACAVVTSLGLRSASATPLDPASFTSLGTLNPAAGTYTVDTNGAAPTLVVGGTTYTGVFVSQGAGLPDIAVYTFDSVTIGNGVAIHQAVGDRPFAILSKSNITFTGSGTVDLGGASNGGRGAGGDGVGGSSGGGGGGFGGNGGAGVGNAVAGAGGLAHGDLNLALEPGSRGGNSSEGAAGGLGGGGIELGAAGTISLASTTNLSARGGDGAKAKSGGGAGSGGGLLLHANVVNTSSGATLQAVGGDTADSSGSSGGAGGGGRIMVQTASYNIGSAVPSPNVAGGDAASRFGNDGEFGVASLRIGQLTIPTGNVFAFNFPGYTDVITTNLDVQAGAIAAKPEAYVNPGIATVRAGAIFSATGPISGGGDWILQSGTVSAPGGITVNAGGLIRGDGAIQGRVAGAPTIRVETGNMTLGDLASTDGISVDAGGIFVGLGGGPARTLALLDADRAQIGNATIAGGSKLSAINGIQLTSGHTLIATGNGTIDGVFRNDGTVSGPTNPASTLTFTDDVSGAGNFTGRVAFSDGFSPGNSPAAVSLETGNFDGTTSLLMELGGTTAGSQYDQLDVSGSLAVDGALQVVLINGFAPSAGDAFTLISGPITGAFDDVSLPALGGGLTWQVDQTSTSYSLSVVPEPSMTIVPIVVFASLLRRKRRA